MWPFDHMEVFHFPSVVSYSIPLLSHLIVPLPTVLSIYPIMTLSKSGSAKQLSDILTNLPFHFQYHLPLPNPRSSQSTDLFWTLISIHPNRVPFPHYVDYLPRQSASILITRRLTAHGYFSPNIPGCFISDDKVAYQKGDIVALGPDAHRKVVMEGVMEVGRYFILYGVKEVGSFPIGHVWTNQLVAPLNLHLSVLLRFLALILMAFFPCFSRSSAVFRKPGEVSKEECYGYSIYNPHITYPFHYY